jgi:hypothetical protein
VQGGVKVYWEKWKVRERESGGVVYHLVKNGEETFEQRPKRSEVGKPLGQAWLHGCVIHLATQSLKVPTPGFLTALHYEILNNFIFESVW